jgi:hypothetical protein
VRADFLNLSWYLIVTFIAHVGLNCVFDPLDFILFYFEPCSIFCLKLLFQTSYFVIIWTFSICCMET